MSSCPAPSDFSQIVQSAQASYSILGNPTFSVTVANTGYTEGATVYTDDFDFLAFNRRYVLDLNFSTTYCDLDLEAIKDCLTGSFRIVDGIVNSISRTKNVDGEEVTLNFESKYHWLTQKSVSTDPFYAVPANDALTELMLVYGGVYLADINNGTNGLSTFGPVTTNNLMEELRAIAQAGGSYLFVQTDGLITSRPWWTCTDELDYTIPCSLVISASRVANNTPPPTVIRARGATVSELNYGLVNFSDLMASANTDTSGFDSVGGGSKKCVRVGISQKDATVKSNNLAGTENDLRNAEILVDGLSIREIAKINKGSMEISVTDGDFLEKGDHSVWYSVSGKIAPSNDDNKKVAPLKQELVRPVKTLDNLKDVLQGDNFSTGGQAFGSGVAGGVGHNDPTHVGVEPSLNQTEVIVYCAAWMTAYGVREEQIDNPYVGCAETLAQIAVTRFQQWLMEQDTWTVDIVPMPCLKLGDYVKIFLPSYLNEGDYIEGIISGITMDWEASDSSTTMKLTIMGTRLLCNTTFQTSNLIRNQNGLSTLEGFGGNATTQNSSVSIDSTEGAIIVYNGGFAYIYLNQVCMVPGDSYVLSFDAEFIDGDAIPLIFQSDAGVSGTIAVSSTLSYPVTASSDTHTFSWYILTAGNSAYWKIRNVQLLKQIVG